MAPSRSFCTPANGAAVAEAEKPTAGGAAADASKPDAKTLEAIKAIRSRVISSVGQVVLAMMNLMPNHIHLILVPSDEDAAQGQRPGIPVMQLFTSGQGKSATSSPQTGKRSTFDRRNMN